MIENCKNCGGKLVFSPKDKGNICENCRSIFPIQYNYNFKKKPFEENVELKVDNFARSLKNIKCNSCGANMMLNKFQTQATCPYCGSTTIEESSKKRLMYIDSIIPFSFGKAEALKRLKKEVAKKFYADKKIFKNVSENEIYGAYVNTFVFDFNTATRYSGVLSYTKNIKDREGNSKTITEHKNISGIFDKTYRNLTVEANSNLEQRDLLSVMPFEYGSAVDFQDDFMHGYLLEYEDKMFNDCVDYAMHFIEKDVERELLKKYQCDSVVHLSLHTDYLDKKYNYCLLPVYFISKVEKNKKYTVIMNGQTGKVGRLPKNKFRVFLTILLSLGILVGFVLLILFMTGNIS